MKFIRKIFFVTLIWWIETFKIYLPTMKVEIMCVIDGFYQTQWSHKWRVEVLCLMIKLMILDTWILQRDMDIEDGEIVKNNFIFS